MKPVTTILSIILLLLSSGCIYNNLQNTENLNETGKEHRLICEKPYITAGASCCLDQDDNKICDTEETEETTQTPALTTITSKCTADQDCAPCGSGCILSSAALAADCFTPTVTCTCINGECISQSTTSSTTTLTQTTTLSASCSDGIQNQGETYADCGGPCTECTLMTIKNSFQEYQNTGYMFKLDKIHYTDYKTEYELTLQTPDKITDYRKMNEGDASYIDWLEFKILKEEKDTITIYVKPDPALTQVPEDSTILTIGGAECNKKAEGLCTREVDGYVFDLNERASDQVELYITLQDGTKTKRWVKTGEPTLIDYIQVSAIHPYVKGGYAVIYVRYI